VGEYFFWYRLTWVLSVYTVVHNCHTQHKTILIIFHLILQRVITAQMISTAKEGGTTTTTTRHRASTSMYSLTFCVRFLLPERHQWKPAVQAAAVMLRMPPSTANHQRASHMHFPYMAHNFENAPVTRQQRAQTPPSRLFTL